MTDYDASLEPPRSFQFGWLFPALFRPRATFRLIASATGRAWLTPILLLTAIALLRVLVAGPIKQAAAQSGQVELPPDYQYYSPEQQAQFQQAIAASSGPVFVYVFPAILGVTGVWVGWLLVSGVLYLTLTLLGGRGSGRAAVNIAAWASLPFAVRGLVQIAFMLVTHQLIGKQGLAGFGSGDDGGMSLFIGELLGQVDVYLLWAILLLVIGVRAADTLSAGKAWAGVWITMLIVVLLQSLPGFVFARLSELTIGSPFFF